MAYQKDFPQYESLVGWEKLSLGEQLHCWAEKYKDKSAIVYAQQRISYTDLEQKSREMAWGFQRMGIQKGDRVVLQLPNRSSFVFAFFGLANIGAIPILALPAHRESEMNGIVSASQAVAYIAPEKHLGFSYLPMVEAIQKRNPCLKNIFVDGDSQIHHSLDSLIGCAQPHPAVEVDCYTPAFLSLSGGTTGAPKLIPRTNSDYMYDARMSAIRCKMNENSVYLAVLPVAHNFILGHPGLLGTLAYGGTVVLCPTSSPDEAFLLIKEERVSITSLVPAIVRSFMDVMEWDDSVDLSSLQVLQVGGALLEESFAVEIIEKWSCKLQQVFGMAEGLNTMTLLDDSNEVIKSCQGKAISPADEFKIVDSNGGKLPPEEYGELLARGPYTIDGYYKAEEINRTSFTVDGFYKTGDRAMLTQDGNLRMGGRLKEQINRAGEKIEPAEIEEFLSEHETIMASSVLGVPDKDLGQRICAFIMTNGEPMDRREIHRFLDSKGLARFKMPDQIECVDIWPVTSVGKVDKKQLALIAMQRYSGGCL